MNGEARIEIATVDWEGAAPRSIFFGDIYYSGDGDAETRHVFLDGNDLPRRFAGACRFAVGELGFGTGLNLLSAWDLWRDAPKSAHAHLDFLSVEKHPLRPIDLARAHLAWPRLGALSERLRALYPPPMGGVHRLALDDDVTLTLAFGDAAELLAKMEARIDAWFFDGFAPSKNPDMWTPALLGEVARLSAPGATAASFSVASRVIGALAGAGFSIEKRGGYGRKREALTARIESGARAPGARAPWFRSARRLSLGAGATVAIIGGGIAGAALARGLSRRGFTPAIIDPKGIAAGASGNPAGVIMPRLDLGADPSARFHRSAYLHAVRLLSDLPDEAVYNPCGVLAVAVDGVERARQIRLLELGVWPAKWVEERADGLFFPQAGIVDPAAFCRALAKGAPLIERRAARIARDARGLFVELEDGTHRLADAIVLANGAEALSFVEARSLPLSTVIGQIDFFPDVLAPPAAISASGFVAPAPNGGVIIGATFEPVAASQAPRGSAASTAENIAKVMLAAPEIGAGLDPARSTPRAAIRCRTPDRLPVAGPLPDWAYYGGAYDGLRFGKPRAYPPGEMQPGLFVLTGLGARGLATAPFCAELIAAELAGAPVETEFAELLHPARFFIRNLKRARHVRRR